MENQKYQFKFLKDEAVDLDLFEGGTHQRIADAIFNIINANEDGMTIGLEGSWGSGKSTIIKILQKKLVGEKTNNENNENKENKENIHYFYFDAWEHEGDPLRRIFLELFIDKVISKLENKEKSKKNNRLIKSLRDEKNKIKHNITSEKVLTTYGKILAASTLLLPFGAALISISSRNSFFINSNSEPDYIVLLGIIMSICPVLIIAFQILRQIKRKIYPPKNKDEELWKIFDQSENTFEFERSTVDFENCFRRVYSTPQKLDSCLRCKKPLNLYRYNWSNNGKQTKTI